MLQMLWIGSVTVVAAIVALMVILAKRPSDELGSVSAQWVAEHRMER